MRWTRERATSGIDGDVSMTRMPKRGDAIEEVEQALCCQPDRPDPDLLDEGELGLGVPLLG